MAYDVLPDIAPDFPDDYQPTARVRVAQFGDSYAQREPDGINYQIRSYSLIWTMLDQADWDTLHDFLFARLQLRPFLWTPPWEGVQRQWLCTNLSGPRATSARFGRIQAAFVEDFTP